MSNKHTPGEWWFIEADEYFEIGVGENNKVRMLAQVGVTARTGTISEAKESKANTRLMTVAPELLAACERVLPWLTKVLADGAFTDTVSPTSAKHAEEQLRTAIAKAKGETK